MYNLPIDKNETNCLLVIDFACHFRKKTGRNWEIEWQWKAVDIESSGGIHRLPASNETPSRDWENVFIILGFYSIHCPLLLGQRISFIIPGSSLYSDLL